MKKLTTLLLLLTTLPVSAEELRIGFDHATEREDGTAFTVNDILEYRVYKQDVEFKAFSNWGEMESHPYMVWWDYTPPYCYTMRTVDIDQGESVDSIEFCSNNNPQAPSITCQ